MIQFNQQQMDIFAEQRFEQFVIQLSKEVEISHGHLSYFYDKHVDESILEIVNRCKTFSIMDESSIRKFVAKVIETNGEFECGFDVSNILADEQIPGEDKMLAIRNQEVYRELTA